MLFFKYYKSVYSNNYTFNTKKASIVVCDRNISTSMSTITSSTKTSSKNISGITNANTFRIPIHEHSRYNLSLYQTTIFPYEHTHRLSSVTKAVLSFRFRPIEFSKKRSLLFFLALELLTSQKAIASLSSRNRQS